jgi:hypothetical protein
VDGTGSELCPVVEFGISGVASLDSKNKKVILD